MRRSAMTGRLIEAAEERKAQEQAQRHDPSLVRQWGSEPHVLSGLIDGAEARRVASDPAGLSMRETELARVAQVEVRTFPGFRTSVLVAVDSRGNELKKKEIWR